MSSSSQADNQTWEQCNGYSEERPVDYEQEIRETVREACHYIWPSSKENLRTELIIRLNEHADEPGHDWAWDRLFGSSELGEAILEEEWANWVRNLPIDYEDRLWN